MWGLLELWCLCRGQKKNFMKSVSFHLYMSLGVELGSSDLESKYLAILLTSSSQFNYADFILVTQPPISFKNHLLNHFKWEWTLEFNLEFKIKRLRHSSNDDKNMPGYTTGTNSASPKCVPQGSGRSYNCAL